MTSWNQQAWTDLVERGYVLAREDLNREDRVNGTERVQWLPPRGLRYGQTVGAYWANTGRWHRHALTDLARPMWDGGIRLMVDGDVRSRVSTTHDPAGRLIMNWPYGAEWARNEQLIPMFPQDWRSRSAARPFLESAYGVDVRDQDTGEEWHVPGPALSPRGLASVYVTTGTLDSYATTGTVDA